MTATPPRRLAHRLSAAFVRTAEPGFYCDGHGLNLRVDPSGARQWVQRLVIRGRPRMLGLGGYPLVSLAEARNAAFANRQRARAGGDPRAEKLHGQGAPTIEEAAAVVLEQQRAGWRNPKHARDWPRSLRAYAFPRIGAMPVSEVTTADVLAVLTPIWHDKPETARRVRQRIGAVMKWAVAMGYRPDNPAGDALGQALGRQQDVVQHMRALPHGAVADALATVRASQALVPTKRAFEFLVLTAARSGEVRLATWDEMDLDAGVWTIPAVRMKAKRDQPRPAFRAGARDPARRTEAEQWHQPGVSQSAREATLQHDALEIDQGTRHRRRAAWVPVELPGLGRGTDEHTPRSGRGRTRPYGTKPHRGGYARSDLFERRRRLMDEWAAYLGGERRVADAARR